MPAIELRQTRVYAQVQGRDMPAQKNQVIEYLRGFAALSVTWFHLTNTYNPGPTQISGSLGWLGVEAFFVISGFIIPYSLASMTDYRWSRFGSFILRRIIRIEIPYLVSIALVLALTGLSAMAPGFAGAPPRYDAGQIASHLLYLTPAFSYEWLQPVYWTLLYEFIFYISIGLLFPIIGRSGQAFPATAVSVVVCSLAFTGLVPCQVLLFVAGFNAFRAIRYSEGLTASVMAAGSLVLIPWAAGVWEQAAVGGVTVIAIIALWRVQFPENAVTRALGFLGAISYSLYLVHIPVGSRVVNLGRRFSDGALAEFLLSLTALGLSISFAYLFWRFIEVPAIALARQMSSRAQALPTQEVRASG